MSFRVPKMWLYCQITYSLISNESNTINIILQLIVKNLTWFFRGVISVNFGAFILASIVLMHFDVNISRIFLPFQPKCRYFQRLQLSLNVCYQSCLLWLSFGFNHSCQPGHWIVTPFQLCCPHHSGVKGKIFPLNRGDAKTL